MLVLMPVLLISCGRKNSELKLPDMSDVNRIEFTYKADFDSAGKIILKTTEVSDEKNIKKILNTVTPGDFPYIYCLSTGSMSFFHDKELLITMVFNTTPDFRHIAYNIDNKVVAVPLSEENAKLLDSFSEKNKLTSQ